MQVPARTLAHVSALWVLATILAAVTAAGAPIGGAVILAAAGGDIPAPIAVPISLGGFALYFGDQYLGRVIRRPELERQLGEVERRCAAEWGTKLAVAEAKQEGAERVAAELRDRLASVRGDRDAWREAQREEVEARRAAERTSASLLEATNTTADLLAALRDAVSLRSGQSPSA